LFLAALFFYPLVQMIGSGVELSQGLVLYPVTAPALILVGALMLGSLKYLERSSWPAYVSGLLIVVGIPAGYSIADGLAFGFISYPLLHLISGRGRQVGWLLYLLGTIFLLRYIFL
jgi:AGZA family xanthine/uracil permease-like MFS transporter